MLIPGLIFEERALDSFLLRFLVIKIHMLKMFITFNFSSAALCLEEKQKKTWLDCDSGQPHFI